MATIISYWRLIWKIITNSYPTRLQFKQRLLWVWLDHLLFRRKFCKLTSDIRQRYRWYLLWPRHLRHCPQERTSSRGKTSLSNSCHRLLLRNVKITITRLQLEKSLRNGRFLKIIIVLNKGVIREDSRLCPRQRKQVFCTPQLTRKDQIH